MNARIEKKLSKKLLQLCPILFKGAWRDNLGSDLAEDQGSSITHCYHLGGGVDYWGEGQDAYSVWEYWSNQWPWIGDFPSYPAGHRFEHYPDVSGFRPTTKNLIDLAINCELRERAD